MNEIDVLLDVVKKLEIMEVKYMLSGSFAMNYYAEPRMTRDIDIVIDIPDDKIDQIVTVFEKDYYITKKSIVEAVTAKKMFNIIHDDAIIKIDFVIKKNTDYRQNEFERRKFIKINSIKISIVSIEDLIISKLIWEGDSKSELQKRDIKNLLQQHFDKNYLDKWLNKLKLKDFFQDFIYE